MNNTYVLHNTRRNLIHTTGLLLLMFVITGVLAYMVAGTDGILVAGLASAGATIYPKFFSPYKLLLSRNAKPLSAQSFFRLYRIAEVLANRAGLSQPPELYCERSPVMNAYTTGHRDQPIVVFTDTLLRNLNEREIAGILAHETAHIRNNDLQVMAVAGAVQRLTGYLSLFGQIMLLITLPLIMAGKITISPLPLLFVVFSPTLSALLQLAVSRAREFDADITGVELTNDPYGLAEALTKMESYHKYYWRRLLLSPWSFKAPTWFQTHPPTSQRIRKLVTLARFNSHETWKRTQRAEIRKTPAWSSGFPARYMHCIQDA